MRPSVLSVSSGAPSRKMVAIRIHGAAPELLQADSLPTDELGPLAPQEFVWLSIGPNFVGWLVQMVLSGVALGVFMSYTRSPDWIDDGRTKRWVLITVTILVRARPRDGSED